MYFIFSYFFKKVCADEITYYEFDVPFTKRLSINLTYRHYTLSKYEIESWLEAPLWKWSSMVRISLRMVTANENLKYLQTHERLYNLQGKIYLPVLDLNRL